MPKLIAALAALISLAGGILVQVDPVTNLWRAAFAFFVGYILTLVWYIFFTIQVKEPHELKRPKTVAELGSDSNGENIS